MTTNCKQKLESIICILKVCMLRPCTGVNIFEHSIDPRWTMMEVPRVRWQAKVTSYYFKVRIVVRKAFQ